MSSAIPKLDIGLLDSDTLGRPTSSRSAPDTDGSVELIPDFRAKPSRMLDHIAKFFHVAGAVLLAIMCALICADAVARLLFNAPFAGTAELVASMLVAVTCLQLPYVLLHKLLLRVTFVLDALGPRSRNFLNGLAYAVGFAFFATISLTGVEPLLKSFATLEYEGTPNFQIPLWPIRLITCVLWSLSALICLGTVMSALRGHAADVDERQHVEDHIV